MAKFWQMNNILFAAHLSAQQRQLWCEDVQNRAKEYGLADQFSADMITSCAICFSASSYLDRTSRYFLYDIPSIWEGGMQQIMDDAACQLAKTFAELTGDTSRIAEQPSTPSAAPPDTLPVAQSAEQAIGLFRNRVHFAIALSELWGKSSFEQTLQALSDAAEIAVRQAASFLLYPQPADTSDWMIFALGKLGAEELNFSSDIDLICLHHLQATATDSPNPVTLTKKLSALLSAYSPYGQGWRVDLRLRPDPSATAVSVSVPAALHYYQSKARSWERAAFIRARPIAGNIDAAHLFLKQIESFIWRRHLDYTVIDDLSVMHMHKAAEDDFLGFDLKKGAYGIRHIELFCHILQLLSGGRHEQIRHHHTQTAIKRLSEFGWLDSEQAEHLTSLYLRWRLLEHRLQYQQDSHTHSLPRNETEFSSFAQFSGFHNADELRACITNLQAETRKHTSHQMMQKLQASHHSSEMPNTSAVESEDLTQTEAYLTSLGFQRTTDILNTLQTWKAGKIAATRTENARHNLQRLLDVALVQMAQSEHPDTIFFAFASMIEKLNAGAKLFALLSEYPHLCRLVSESMSQSPFILQRISAHPELLDLWVDSRFSAPITYADEEEIYPFRFLQDTAFHDASTEARLDYIRLIKKEIELKAAFHLLHHSSPHHAVSRYLSQFAEIAVCTMAQTALADIERRYGRIAQFNFAIIGLGRLGARNMTLTSDLDIIFVYQAQNDPVSDGQIQIGATGYALKLAQRIINFLSTHTAQGSLYETDLRLRPDGNAGPLAVHYDRLSSYLQAEAWPWEAIAFQKARLIWQSDDAYSMAGDSASLSALVTQLQTHAKSLSLPQLKTDILAMMSRLDETQPAKTDLKKRQGGLLYADFLKCLTEHPDNAAQHLLSAPALEAADELEQFRQLLSLTSAKRSADDQFEWLSHITSQPDTENRTDSLCQMIEDRLNQLLDDIADDTTRPR